MYTNLLEKPCGLVNSGNSCYLNAVLQSITAVPIFQRNVAQYDFKGTKYLVMKNFIRAANRGEVFTPAFPKLSANEQEDAHEYMLSLMENDIPKLCTIFISTVNIKSM